MIITHHREKLINAILYFARHTKHCGTTKLLKLLYFLDFWHFKQTGKSVTGLEYYAWKMGPVPKTLYDELPDNMQPDLKDAIDVRNVGGMQRIIAKKSYNDAYFTNREKKLLENLVYIFKDAKASDMVESTHLRNEPWDRTLKEKGEWQHIDYLLAIDDKENTLSYKDARERMEERAEMHRIFGVV